MPRKRENYLNCYLDISVNRNPSHKDGYKLSIYCRNNKNTKSLSADNSHSHKSGLGNFHGHNPNKINRDFVVVLGIQSEIKDYVEAYIAFLKKYKVIDKGEELELIIKKTFEIVEELYVEMKSINEK